MEFLSLRGQHFTDACRLAFHMVRLVFGTLLQQLAVEFLQRTYTRQWNTDISSDIAHKVFDQVLLIVGCGIAEHGIKAVMSGKLCVIVLGNSIRPKATLDCDTGVVKNDLSGNAAKELACPGQSIQDALQVLTVIRHDKGSTVWRRTGSLS